MRRRSFGSLVVLLSMMAGCSALSMGCGGGASGGGDGTGDDTGAIDESGGDSTSSESASDSSGSEGAVDTGGVGDSSSGDSSTSETLDDSASADSSGEASDTGSTTDTSGADTALEASLDTGVDTAPEASVDTGVDTAVPDTAPDPCVGGATCSVDTDLDGIPDRVEGRCGTTTVDTDGDGTADYLDLDSDDDTIPDKVEWAAGGCDPTAAFNDANGDGTPNFRDLDSDGNGLPDKFEACPPAGMPGFPAGCTPATPADFDRDGAYDWLDVDNDHDSANADLTIGLEDVHEVVNNAGAYVGPKVLVPYKTYDTTAALIDTDADGIPDVWDRDADNDNIFDLTDGLGDPNKNGVANFRDTDSDGDGVKDACEARGNPDFTPSYLEAAKDVADTNGDGFPDYTQRDTDGDFLLDGAGPLGDPTTGEDKNGNCIVDASETDRLKTDTDGDGVSDFVEVTVVDVACAKDKTCTPATKGKFYFIVPYSPDGSAKPTPANGTLALQTNLTKGDVAFIVDTSISMDGEMIALKTGLSAIITALSAKFTNLGIGVGGHDDFPSPSITNFASGSRPFYVAPRAGPAIGYITADGGANAQTAANSFQLTPTTGNTSSGGDIPESQIGAMMRALKADTVLAWSDGSAPHAVAVDSPPAGTFGHMHFRTGALPILIPITDAGFHNGKRALTAPPTGVAGDYDAADQNVYPAAITSPNSDALVAQITAVGAKVIGVSADNGSRNTAANYLTDPIHYPYGFLSYLADKTGSFVPKTAFSGAPATCKTNIGGASTAADGPAIAGSPSCRLVFSINTDGSGLSNSIITGVGALLNAIQFDVHVQARTDPTATPAAPLPDTVDAFMSQIAPLPGGGVDPITSGVCVSFPAANEADRYTGPKATAGADLTNETITGLTPGKLYCFSVIPKPNVIVPAKSTAQVYRALLSVIAEKAGGSITLGSDREVTFVVPPILN